MKPPKPPTPMNPAQTIEIPVVIPVCDPRLATALPEGRIDPATEQTVFYEQPGDAGEIHLFNACHHFIRTAPLNTEN